MTYSLAITTYNRSDLTIKSFENVHDDPRIGEIVIVDDFSERHIFDQLFKESIRFNKVKLVRNKENLGMSKNKKEAIQLCKNEWVIIFDSDNQMDFNYLDPIPGKLDPKTIYCPDFAAPHFDYRKYSGKRFRAFTIKRYIPEREMSVLVNTCNYLVNREEYLKVWEPNSEIKGTDTIWFNYLWLKSGGNLQVVKGMKYHHRVHDKSGFLEHCDYNMDMADKIKKMIMAL